MALSAWLTAASGCAHSGRRVLALAPAAGGVLPARQPGAPEAGARTAPRRSAIHRASGQRLRGGGPGPDRLVLASFSPWPAPGLLEGLRPRRWLLLAGAVFYGLACCRRRTSSDASPGARHGPLVCRPSVAGASALAQAVLVALITNLGRRRGATDPTGSPFDVGASVATGHGSAVIPRARSAVTQAAHSPLRRPTPGWCHAGLDVDRSPAPLRPARRVARAAGFVAFSSIRSVDGSSRAVGGAGLVGFGLLWPWLRSCPSSRRSGSSRASFSIGAIHGCSGRCWRWRWRSPRLMRWAWPVTCLACAGLPRSRTSSSPRFARGAVDDAVEKNRPTNSGRPLRSAPT